MKRALFIGRFQPFHLGHLSVIKDIDLDSDINEIIIGIGSSQYAGTEENPFSFVQRKNMITKALREEIKKPFQIIDIPDIHDEHNWVKHVINLVPRFTYACTGNDWVKKLFLEAKVSVKPLDFKIDINGTKLRQMIKENKEWEKYVPKAIIPDIKNQ